MQDNLITPLSRRTTRASWFMVPLLTLRMRCISETGVLINDESAANIVEVRKIVRYALPGQVSSDERNYKLTTLAVEKIECLGEIDSEFVDQRTGGEDNKNQRGEADVKEPLMMLIFLTIQVAISRNRCATCST